MNDDIINDAKIVQESLGHKDVKTTFRHYIHGFENDDVRAQVGEMVMSALT